MCMPQYARQTLWLQKKPGSDLHGSLGGFGGTETSDASATGDHCTTQNDSIDIAQ